MSDSVFRPDPDALRRFLLGQLAGPELEAVERYLRDHPEALSTLNELTVEDTLTAAVRRGRDVPGLGDPGLTDLTERMKLLPGTRTVTAEFRPDTTPPQAEGETGGDPSDEPPPEPTEFADDPLTLLAPAEGPGELGRLGGYRVLGVLGRGGMGVVFEAEELKLGRRVALKVMAPALAARPGARDRFVREAKAAAKVEHDHIVPIYQIGEDRGVPFLAMPLLKGQTLDDRLRSGGRLSVAETVRIAQQVAEGLAAAHAAGLIHRDVKPSNVWLEAHADGSFKRVRLLDFGLARLARGDDRLTGSGAVLGTPAYMAPEQARGGAVDARADLFSLGCVLYQMTTGRRPFAGSDTFSVLTSLAVDTPAPPAALNPAVPAALSELVVRLLAKDPANRPPTAQQVFDELAALETHPSPDRQGGVAVEPLPDGRGSDGRPEGGGNQTTEELPLALAPAATPPRRRGRWKPVAAALLALAGLGGALAYGGTIVRIVNNEGELVIETDDKDIQVLVKQDGAEIRDTDNSGATTRVYVLRAVGGEVEFRDPQSGAVALTKKFELKRGDKVRLTAKRAEIAAAQPPAPPDRAAAEWVLSIGGVVKIDDEQAEIRTTGDLPKGPFRLTLVFLRANPKVADAELARLGACDSLAWLDLTETKVTAAGLVHLKDCKKLTALVLDRTALDDAAADSIADVKNLTQLYLTGTRFTAAGIDRVSRALPHCRIRWDGGTTGPRSDAPPPRVPDGAEPPAKDAFPGELLAYETFDDPKACPLFQGTHDGVRYAVEDGRYVADGPMPAAGQFRQVRLGEPAADAAFVVRVRGVNCVPFVSFRLRRSAEQATWLALGLDPPGHWRVIWGRERAAAGWRAEFGGVLAKAAATDPELAEGKWVTLAGRTSGKDYEVWVNGRSAARGTVTAATFAEGSEAGPPIVLGAYKLQAGQARLEVDHVAVWKLPTAAAADFRELHGADRAALKAWIDRQRADGYRPTTLGLEAGPGPRFTAVAVKDPRPVAWQFFDSLDEEGPEWERSYKRARAEGLRLVCKCYPITDGRRLTSGLWAAREGEHGYWYGDRDFVLENIRGAQAAGLRPIDLTAATREGKLTFSTVLAPAGGRAWDTHFALTADGLRKLAAAARARGWRLDWVSAYRDGGRVRFLAITVEDRAMDGWHFDMDLPAAAYESGIAEQKALGRRPLTVAGYDRDGETRYAAVWVRHPPASEPPEVTVRGLFDQDAFAVKKSDGGIAVSPDGRWLAVPLGGDKHEVWLFDMATRQVRHKLTGHTQRPLRAAFSPDGRLVASAGMDGLVRVWEVETGKPKHALRHGGEYAVSVAFSPDGRQLASGGQTTVRLWNVENGTQANALPVAVTGDVHGLAYSPDGKWLAYGAGDKALRLWNLERGAVERVFDNLPEKAVGVAFSPDSRLLSAGESAGPTGTYLRVWSVPDGKPVLAKDGVPGGWVTFAPDSKTLWAGPWGVNDTAAVVRLDLTGRELARFTYPDLEGWAGFALVPGRATLYAADSTHGVRALDALTGRPKPATAALTPEQRQALRWALAIG